MSTALADFKSLMWTRFFFNFGVEMQAVLLGWRMYSLTHDPLYLGFIGLAEAVPALSLAMYAGYIVDRSAPLKIYRWVLYGSLLSGLIMFSSQLTTLSLSDHWQVVALFVASFVTGTARGFSQPSMFAIVPHLVQRADFSKSSAFMSGAMQVARIGGPAFGGLVFALAGITQTSFVVCIMLLISLAFFMSIRTEIPAPKPTGLEKNKRTELLSGASFVFRHPILFPALTLDMVSVLFGGVTALLPIYASDILMVGPKGFGALRAAPAVGAALMSFWLTRKQIKEKAGPALFGAVGAFGVCMLVFSISHSFWLSLVALAFSGAFDSISMVIRGAAVQLSSPNHMRGRISAVNSIFIGSSNELGELESGLTAKLMGTVNAAVFGSAICIATVGIIAVIAPALRKLDLRKLEEAQVE
jgi:MFS family permease